MTNKLHLVPNPVFSSPPLGTDGRSKDAAGLRLDSLETLSIRLERILHG